MSQEEVIQLLRKNKEMTIKEIAEETQLSLFAVWKNLRSLLKEYEVEKRVLTKRETDKFNKKFTGRNYVWKIKEK